MPLSHREQRILATIEDHVGRNDPELAATFAENLRSPLWRRWYPLTALDTGLLVLVLTVLVIAHPLALPLGPAGVGLLTVALVLPWLVRAIRARPRTPRPPARKQQPRLSPPRPPRRPTALW
jgi:DUF3040 family protein